MTIIHYIVEVVARATRSRNTQRKLRTDFARRLANHKRIIICGMDFVQARFFGPNLRALEKKTGLKLMPSHHTLEQRKGSVMSLAEFLSLPENQVQAIYTTCHTLDEIEPLLQPGDYAYEFGRCVRVRSHDHASSGLSSSDNEQPN